MNMSLWRVEIVSQGDSTIIDVAAPDLAVLASGIAIKHPDHVIHNLKLIATIDELYLPGRNRDEWTQAWEELYHPEQSLLDK